MLTSGESTLLSAESAWIEYADNSLVITNLDESSSEEMVSFLNKIEAIYYSFHQTDEIPTYTILRIDRDLIQYISFFYDED